MINIEIGTFIKNKGHYLRYEVIYISIYAFFFWYNLNIGYLIIIKDQFISLLLKICFETYL